MQDTRGKFALIGAGPMGLAAAKVLREQGIAFQGFELHSDVGGLWDITAPRSTMYESAHLISSKTMTEFTDFPMRDEVDPLWPSVAAKSSWYARPRLHPSRGKSFAKLSAGQLGTRRPDTPPQQEAIV